MKSEQLKEPTPSKFADDLSRRLTHGLTEKELAWGAGVIDQALAPVRECLEELKQRDLSTGPCWCRSSTLPNAFLEDPAKWKHSDACLAAQQLYERLKVQ